MHKVDEYIILLMFFTKGFDFGLFFGKLFGALEFNVNTLRIA